MILTEKDKIFIKENINRDTLQLALEGVSIFLLSQIKSRQKAEKKLPSYYHNNDIIFPEPISVEQSSSEKTANFKASLISGNKFLDMTGGFGIDTIAFSKSFKEITYLEKNEKLYELFLQNIITLKIDNIRAINIDADEYIFEEKFDLIYLDPSRRNQLQKVFKLEDCSPNIKELIPKIEKHTDNIMIKLSPMIDIDLLFNEFKKLNKVYIIQSDKEVKEILCVFDNSGDKKIIVCDLDKEKQIEFEGNQTNEFNVSSIKKYIYELSPALMKSGKFDFFANTLGLYKLDPNTNYYTSDELLEDFWGNIYSLVNVIRGKDISSQLPDKKAVVKSKNYPLYVSQIRKRFGILEGTDDYLFFTRNLDKNIIFHCKKIS